MKGAKLLAETLKENRVRYIFGVPGDIENEQDKDCNNHHYCRYFGRPCMIAGKSLELYKPEYKREGVSSNHQQNEKGFTPDNLRPKPPSTNWYRHIYGEITPAVELSSKFRCPKESTRKESINRICQKRNSQKGQEQIRPTCPGQIEKERDGNETETAQQIGYAQKSIWGLVVAHDYYTILLNQYYNFSP